MVFTSKKDRYHRLHGMRKRSRNSGRLLAKTGSNDQLSDDVKTLEKSRFKTNHFCKMIVLFSITKQLPTNIMTKL